MVLLGYRQISTFDNYGDRTKQILNTKAGPQHAFMLIYMYKGLLHLILICHINAFRTAYDNSYCVDSIKVDTMLCLEKDDKHLVREIDTEVVRETCISE